MKTKLFAMMMFAASLFGFSSCSSDDDDETIYKEPTITFKDGMLKLTENIGDWDVAIIYGENGYILHKEETIDEDTKMDYVQIQSPDAEYDCAIYANTLTSLPEILITEEETYYFNNSGDTLLYISRATEENIETIDSIAFTLSIGEQSSTKGSTFTTITYLNRDDKVEKVIKALNAVLNAGTEYTSSQIKKLKKALDEISIFYYYENVEEKIDSLDLCRETYGEKGDSVIYCFTQYAEKVKIITYTSAKYYLIISTGYPVRVRSTSAVVPVKLDCVSDKYRTLGQWGIVYSSDVNNLSLSNYEGIVYASENSGKTSNLTMSGLKPNTKYYYKAFYKFKTGNHDDLVFRYGNRSAESYVNNRDYSLTTKEKEDEDYLAVAVDLGLSVKWASCNVGASSPEEYGGYYTCEEVMSAGYRLPTDSEIDELWLNCTWTWSTLNGVNGYKVTSSTGNSIFLPAAGFYDGETIISGSYCYYWHYSLSSYDSTNCNSTYYMWFENVNGTRNKEVSLGYSVRPVSE